MSNLGSKIKLINYSYELSHDGKSILSNPTGGRTENDKIVDSFDIDWRPYSLRYPVKQDDGTYTFESKDLFHSYQVIDAINGIYDFTRTRTTTVTQLNAPITSLETAGTALVNGSYSYIVTGVDLSADGNLTYSYTPFYVGFNQEGKSALNATSKKRVLTNVTLDYSGKLTYAYSDVSAANNSTVGNTINSAAIDNTPDNTQFISNVKFSNTNLGFTLTYTYSKLKYASSTTYGLVSTFDEDSADMNVAVGKYVVSLKTVDGKLKLESYRTMEFEGIGVSVTGKQLTGSTLTNDLHTTIPIPAGITDTITSFVLAVAGGPSTSSAIWYNPISYTYHPAIPSEDSYYSWDYGTPTYVLGALNSPSVSEATQFAANSITIINISSNNSFNAVDTTKYEFTIYGQDAKQKITSSQSTTKITLQPFYRIYFGNTGATPTNILNGILTRTEASVSNRFEEISDPLTATPNYSKNWKYAVYNSESQSLTDWEGNSLKFTMEGEEYYVFIPEALYQIAGKKLKFIWNNGTYFWNAESATISETDSNDGLKYYVFKLGKSISTKFDANVEIKGYV